MLSDLRPKLIGKRDLGSRRKPERVESTRPELVVALSRLTPNGSRGISAVQAAGGKPVGFATADRHTCTGYRDRASVFPFTIAFQPIVDLQESRIDAYEALVRGPSAEGAEHVLGQVTPDNVYAFDQACRVKAIELASRLGLDRQLSINFLPSAVHDPRACIEATLRVADRAGFHPDRLTFEILETEASTNTAHLVNIIREYKKRGVKIALDDFATGYSGLARLADLKPDIVKIDRVLIKDCDKDRTRMTIVAGMITICAEIGVKVIIEGVERAEEVVALRAAGARFIQGFYFAKPLFESIALDADIRWTSTVPCTRSDDRTQSLARARRIVLDSACRV